jgi:hypothetical protein
MGWQDYIPDKYYDQEDVIGSASKYHRLSCPTIRNIYRRNLKRLSSWEIAEKLGLEPCGLCNPFHLVSAPPPPVSDDRLTEGTETMATPSQLSDWRRDLMHLLKKLDQETDPSSNESVAARIGRLSRTNVIPREIAAFMRSITETRNVAEYEARTLSKHQSEAVRAAWKAIQEWAGNIDKK